MCAEPSWHRRQRRCQTGMAAATGGRGARALTTLRRRQTWNWLRERKEQNGTQTWSQPRLTWFVGEVPANVRPLWPICGKRYASADVDSRRTSFWQQAWQAPRWKDSPPRTKLMRSGQRPSANELDENLKATKRSGTNLGFARTQRVLLLPAARWCNLRTSLSTWQ